MAGLCRALMMMATDEAHRTSKMSAWRQLGTMIERAELDVERATTFRVAIYRAIWPEHAGIVY
jgi:hypothetical protein